MYPDMNRWKGGLEQPPGKQDWKERSQALSARIGGRIRDLRRERGLSLEEVGGTELTRSYMSLVEHGRTRISLQSLMIVAERLGVSMVSLLEDI